jgi:hypothetical protein
VYTMPSFPLTAGVWYDADNVLPPAGLYVESKVSLSPLKPGEWAALTWHFAELTPTHIIRSLPDPRYRDSTQMISPSTGFPTTIFEVPVGSQHWYAAVWSHEVGAGFPNHHARVFVARHTASDVNGTRTFIGWI